MLVLFEELTENAKVWIYPCSRKFYPQEIEILESKLKEFVENWSVDFKGSFKLIYNRFIIFAIDENISITNKLIDKKVAFILELEQIYEVTLLDKMNVCFKQGEHVQYKELKDFKTLLKNKSVSNKTIVFDNLVQTKYDLEHFWEVPITESWYSRML